MGEPVPLVLNVRGDLDTSAPVTDRPLGALTRARDMHSQRWGPREGSQSFTRVWESPGTASLYDGITLNGTNQARAFGHSLEDAFGDLGTTFTLDLWIRAADFTYAAAVDRIGVYSFGKRIGTTGSCVTVNLFGGLQTDHERIEVRIITAPTRATVASTVTFTGSTRLTAGSTQTLKHHIRVVRDGANGYLYLNGILDGSTSSLSATDPINRPLGSVADVLLWYSADAGDITFNGSIYGAVLRDGAFRTDPIEAVMPCSPFARNIHHYYLGRNYALGGEPHIFDAGRFAAHARVIYTVGADYTVTSSNDNAAPAPAVVQGLRTWTTRTNRTATTVAVGGQLNTAIVS